MRGNIICDKVCGRLWALLLAGILTGCASSDRGKLGRLQVGDAGGTCSFFTTIFDGPDVGRGRNEGHLKSYSEIKSLFGPFGSKARRLNWQLAALGMGLDEYQCLGFGEAPPALSLREDTFITAKMVRDRHLAPDEDVQAYYRRLFTGCFINTDALVDALEQGGVGIDEVRDEFWRWVGYTYKDYRLDYYHFEGNRNMARRLYEHGVITKREATYLLARWFLERTAYEPGMIDDLEYFQIISSEDASVLTKLELAYLAPFNIEPAEREKLLAQQAIVYNAVRAKVKWPLTIPRLSKLRAIAPSFRNRYADHYNPNEYIAIESLVIPKPIGKYKGYDPRIAVSINDGRKLSFTERLSRWWGPGHLFSAFGAARGETQTEYVFRKRLHSPGGRFLVELVASARNRGVITPAQHAEYIATCVRHGYSSRWLYSAAREYDLPILPEIAANIRFWGSCFVYGIDYDDYQLISTLPGGAYRDMMSRQVRASVSNCETADNAITIKCAEKVGLISQRESDALLAAHFYLLLEQLADTSWVPTRLEHGWRMKAQRSEVERAVYEFKAVQAVKAFEDVHSRHD